MTPPCGRCDGPTDRGVCWGCTKGADAGWYRRDTALRVLSGARDELSKLATAYEEAIVDGVEFSEGYGQRLYDSIQSALAKVTQIDAALAAARAGEERGR